MLQQQTSFDGFAGPLPGSMQELSPIGQWAIYWGSVGLRVFPITPGAKFPPLVRFTEAATSDPTRIAFVWQTYPTANIGVLCGETSQLLVLDIDAESETKPNGFAALNRLWKDMGGDRWKPFMLTRSPNGGRHLYFKCFGPIPKGLDRKYPGINFKYNNGYVLIGPSLIDAGPYLTSIVGKGGQ